MPEALRQRSTTAVFRRERRWFSSGLAALTFAYIAGRIAYGKSTFDFDVTFLFQCATSGAASMWLAGYLAYSMTHSRKLAAEPIGILDTGIHVLVVPFVAFPAASLFLGLLTAGFSEKALNLGATALMGNVMLIILGWGGALLFAIPCLVITCVWSGLFLYVIRPKYLAGSNSEVTVD